jgi:hypothetical protein
LHGSFFQQEKEEKGGNLSEEMSMKYGWKKSIELLNIRNYGTVARDSEVPGSIPGATRFSENYWVWIGIHLTS